MTPTELDRQIESRCAAIAAMYLAARVAAGSGLERGAEIYRQDARAAAADLAALAPQLEALLKAVA